MTRVLYISLVALVLAGASILLSSFLFTKLSDEGAERRDQSCRLFESDHLADVTRLERTYEFLGRQRRPSSLVREVVRGLPELEREARLDRAPAYCDEPGAAAERAGENPVGLPEPDPVLPAPRSFEHLLKKK